MVGWSRWAIALQELDLVMRLIGLTGIRFEKSSQWTVSFIVPKPGKILQWQWSQLALGGEAIKLVAVAPLRHAG
jgi:hypothetical protein